ncbi:MULTISPECIES: bifunctional oligoribonuclease/PAP phosphatase NrnA [unclassified Mycoplasma]|uniref:DHH family phosphoesterase n=1 Tax=unclassified Mycoplasma TaxID=2683645 RepID=UPI00211C9BEC|nr:MULTISPECIES: bifunctional oligoribonuclease/PAP phosphatase NrnA [unclassified Mycoplasma]UUM19979.1 bifunctional oligoribonuclease/PAP phosphatase NrnA [Mycoplasma sp. 1578d]UUM24960.1 bifunctional oligoribonuclease/PAP phosphatase NrnA [Mycoplasma sp. 3686d]
MQIGSLKQAVEQLLKYDSIVIFHHIQPDGDCLGSQHGLGELLRTNFPNKQIYCVGDENGLFPFLNIQMDPNPSDEILKKSLAVIVDANYKDRIHTRELLDKEIFAHVLRIDHHPNDDDLGDNVTRWVDSSYIAADEMIAEIAYETKWKISKQAARFLYLGMVTDSGRFLFSNTSARTLKLASYLYENGLDADFMHLNMYKTSIEEIKFNAWLTSTLKTRDGVAYLQNSYQDTIQRGRTPEKSVRPNLISNIDGFPIWAQFIEEKDGKVRVELRSNGPVVRNVALKWGGGGHLKASGCVLDSVNDIESVIDDCALEVQKYLQQESN